MSWYVVQTLVKDELRAKEHLLRQEYDVFLPLFGKVVIQRQQRKINLSALFPGYLFVQFDPTITQWRAINGTRGVQRLLCLGDTPSPIHNSIIQSIQARLDKFGVMMANGFEQWKHLIDQKMQITDGTFKGHSGICVWADGERVKILLAILGRNVVIALPQSQTVVID